MKIQEVFERYRMECAAVGEELDRIFTPTLSLSDDERLVRHKQMQELIGRRDTAMRELLALRGPWGRPEPHGSPIVAVQGVAALANQDESDSAAAVELAISESPNQAGEEETSPRPVT